MEFDDEPSVEAVVFEGLAVGPTTGADDVLITVVFWPGTAPLTLYVVMRRPIDLGVIWKELEQRSSPDAVQTRQNWLSP